MRPAWKAYPESNPKYEAFPMGSHMISRTKVSKGYLTVVPKEVRRASQVREGDVLEWSLEGDVIVVRPRHRRTVDDIAGIISHGGDAVASKRGVQRRQRDRR
ncbi:MAG: AbrB/MazE/SpoVT family DNA-binding domain-containing protein [Methanobacteriota archaeon]